MSIINSTIADNTTTSGADGAGLSNESAASYTVYNSIIWGNTNFNVNATSPINATYCIIQPVGDMHSGTTGNLTSNPLFTGGTNYTLQVTSPAINAGNTPGAPTTDITSATRTGNPDMGCFESGSTNPTTSLACTLFLSCTNPVITSAAPASSICSGQTFTTSLVSSPVGATYLWTSSAVTGITGHSTSGNGNINETLTNTTTNPLTVTYTITPINGLCNGTAVTYSVTVNPYPTINSTAPTNSICSGTTFTTSLTSSVTTAGTTYSWTSPAVTGITGHTTSGTGNVNETLVNTSSGPLDVTYTITPSFNGCDGTPVVYTVTVQPVSTITSSAPASSICSGDVFSTSLSASTAGAGTTYTWTSAAVTGITGHSTSGTGNISETLVNTTSGPLSVSYTVTPVFNTCNGTPVTYSVTVNPVATITSAAPPAAICSGNTFSTSLSASTGVGSTFAWTSSSVTGITGHSTSGTGDINETLTNTTGAPVSVTYTVTPSFGGCAGTSSSYTVLVDVIDISLSATPTITCTATSVTLTGSSSSAGVNFNWIDNSGNPAGTSPTSTSTVVNAAGTYFFIVTNPTTGCDDTLSLTVTTDTLTPNVSVSAAPVLDCNSSTVFISGSSSSSDISYSWTDALSSPAGTNPDSSSTGITTAGTYTLTVTDTTTGCTAISTLTVTQSSDPVASANSTASSTLTCTDTVLTLDGSLSSTGATLVYSWTGPGIVSGDSTLNPVINAQGTYVITVTDTATGCFSTASIVISSNTTSPTAVANATSAIDCANPGIDLDGASSTPGVGFSWSGPGIVSGATTAAPLVNTPGTYVLTVTDLTNGCTDTASVTVTIDTLAPVVAAGNDTLINCNQSSIVLTGSPSSSGYTYTWIGPGVVSGASTATATVNAAGTYVLVVTASNGCAAADTVQVSSLTGPTAAFSTSTSSTQAPVTVTTSNSSTGVGISYQWDLGNGDTSSALNPSVTYTGGGTYTITLTVTDSNGCTAVATATIDVLPFDLDIPNGFTPNGDGINDAFTIVGLEQYPENNIKIFNRWGDLVFSAEPYLNDWIGNSNNKKMRLTGEQVVDGTYFFILDLNTGDKPINGYVELKTK
jgi:gliding motility-associated-like protein